MAAGVKELKDNAARLVAITAHERSMLVEAGAGSGKTAVMAGRIALMLAGGCAPRSIAAVTFTELAASELLLRVREFVADLLEDRVAPELRIALPAGLSETQRANLLSVRDLLGCLTLAFSVGAGMKNLIGGIMVGLVALWMVHRSRQKDGKLVEILVSVTLLLIILGMFLPALGTAGTTASSVRDVTVLDRRVVGAFDTTTIASGDPQAIESWLAENGYATHTNSRPVLADYIKQGWVFVAAKVRRDGRDTTNSVLPLSFTFPTPKAVYPMRLTGVGAGPLSVELFVFGPKRAEAPGFKVERCAVVSREQGPRPIGIPVLHPLLNRWIRSPAICTKFTAELAGPALAQDVWLDWKPFTETRTVVYSRVGALHTVLNQVVPWLVVIALAATGWWRWGHRSFVRRGRYITALAAAGVGIAGFLSWDSLSKIEVRLQKLPKIYGAMATKSFLIQALSASGLPAQPSAAQLRAAIAIPNTIPPNVRTNVLLGGLIHEEDSPGNYVLRDRTNGLEVLWYDFAAAEQRFDAN